MLGIEIIPGIEISAFDVRRNKRAHILGYSINPGHPALEQLCRPLLEKRHQASLEMICTLEKSGFDISLTEVEKIAAGSTGIYKQHIMHALVEKGYSEHIYSDLYRRLFSRGGENSAPGIAFIPLDYIEVLEAISAINSAGGVAVLAHPGEFYNFDAVPEWVRAGLQGIEVYHPSHDRESLDLSLELARRFNLVVTGGSDYHGLYDEIPVNLGCPQLDLSVINQLNNLGKWNISCYSNCISL